MSYWIFANKQTGFYEESDWDTSTILRTKRYYFKQKEPNRGQVKPDDLIIFREYSGNYWGSCEITGEWVEDMKGMTKHQERTGWFPIRNIKKWKTEVPYELVKADLFNQNHRLRIAKANEADFNVLEIARKILERLQYGATGGSLFLMENGVEEAVKANLGNIGLRLADPSIGQQCVLDVGAGRTDLICLDKDDNYVVLELKAVRTSDEVVGQILRYMGYISENWAEKEGRKVSGVILTPSYDENLRLAARQAGITVKLLRIV